MSLTDKWAETIYQIATTRKKLRIISIPAGLTFWFGFSALFVFASLWLDRLIRAPLLMATPVNIYSSLPLLIIGATLALWTVLSFFIARGSPVPLNPPKRLVTTGLYSRVRNPMVLGWFMILFGLGLLLDSISLLFIFTPLFIFLNVLYIKTIEEKEMEKKFGEEYLGYKKSVPAFIPRFGKRK